MKIGLSRILNEGDGGLSCLSKNQVVRKKVIINISCNLVLNFPLPGGEDVRRTGEGENCRW